MYIVSKSLFKYSILLLGADEISYKDFRNIAKKHAERGHKIFVELNKEDYFFVRNLLRQRIIPTKFKRFYNPMFVINNKKIYRVSI